jgi:hypothetical protein
MSVRNTRRNSLQLAGTAEFVCFPACFCEYKALPSVTSHGRDEDTMLPSCPRMSASTTPRSLPVGGSDGRILLAYSAPHSCARERNGTPSVGRMNEAPPEELSDIIKSFKDNLIRSGLDGALKPSRNNACESQRGEVGNSFVNSGVWMIMKGTSAVKTSA